MANEDFVHFEVDDNIVSDLIHSQNGTVPTGIRELVINALDAGSPYCNVTIGPNRFIVEDAGVGFADKNAVMTCFRRFGHKHDEENLPEHGRFRIGRGQIMSLAKAHWHSGPFHMETDVRSQGNGFSFRETPDDLHQGCKVSGEFYTKQYDWSVKQAVNEIAKLVRYTPQAVTINGARVNQTDCTWCYEDDDIKILWNPKREDGVYLYSQGVFVKDLHYHAYGFSADIVTKRALKLNMARNEISQTDPLWQKVEKILGERAKLIAKEKSKEGRLDEASRRMMIARILIGELGLDEHISLPLVRDCRGHYTSIWSLSQRSRPLTLAPESGSRFAERIASTQTASVLHHDELRIWQVDSLDDLVSLWRRATNQRYMMQRLGDVRCLNFDDLSKNFNVDVTILKSNDLTLHEQAARAALQYAGKNLSKRITTLKDVDVPVRKILVGESDRSDAWTDGLTFIAFNREILHGIENGLPGLSQAAMLLIHEYEVHEDDSKNHTMDFRFFQQYHEHTLNRRARTEIVGHTIRAILTEYQAQLKNKQLPFPKWHKDLSSNAYWSDSYTVTGYAQSNKLSSLAKIILDKSGVQCNIKKRSWTFVFPSSSQGEKKLYRAIFDSVKGAMQDAYGKPPYSEPMDFNAKMEKEEKWYGDLVGRWCAENGHNEAFVKAILRRVDLPGRPYSPLPLNLLQALCADPDCGMYAFEGRLGRGESYLGGPEHLFMTAIPFYVRKEAYAQHHLSLAESKGARFASVTQQIKEAVEGLSETEKAEYVQKMFSEGLSSQI